MQGHNPKRRESSCHFLFSSWGSHWEKEIPCILCISCTRGGTKLRNINLLIWFPSINSAFDDLSHPSYRLYSYFYPKREIFPKFGIITILYSRDISNCSFITVRIELKFSMLEFVLNCCLLNLIFKPADWQVLAHALNLASRFSTYSVVKTILSPFFIK